MARRVEIGLLWHSLRAGNLGVGALTIANIAIIREVAGELGLEPHFTVLSMRETYGQSALPEVDVFSIDGRSMLSPSGYARQVSQLDCVIDIGAGDSFTDIYGAKRFAFLWLSKLLVVEQNKPLILAPQTIGPFTGRLYRRAASHIMRRAAAVMSRDATSLEETKALAPDADAHRAVDVAFLLPFEDRSDQRGGPRLRIGINASGLLCSQAESGQNRFGLSYDYLNLQRRLIEYWLNRGDEVHLITHANSLADKSDDDGARADSLAREYPDAVRIPSFAGPSEAKSHISGLDFLVAGRMHACVGAFSSGTPVVPLAYSRKFAGLFDLLEYPWYTPVSGASEDEVFAFVTDAFEQRDKLQAAERAGMEKVDRLMESYRDVLRRELSGLPDRDR